MNRRRFNQLVFSTVSGLAALAMLVSLAHASTRIIIQGPPGSETFGKSVTVLPNGNLVICDPGYDAEGIVDVGAVYLYNGATGTLISMLTGSTKEDKVCVDGVTVLSNGNFVITSRLWNNGDQANAGAVTWADAGTGISGVVNAGNSLVGSTEMDLVGIDGVVELPNGNYLVLSTDWDNGNQADAGAVTWGDGMTGVTGPIAAANSLVGSTKNDAVGKVTRLANGDYVVVSLGWDNGAAVNAGAVTWGSGAKGIRGIVSPANSLVGSSNGDLAGNGGVKEFFDGRYVVLSPGWDNGSAVNAGAVTWSKGLSGITGSISAANSLVGSTGGDFVGMGVWEFDSGNYLVFSPNWDNGTAVDAGAVTWVNNKNGLTGPVSLSNSLVGSSAYDVVGNYGLNELGNGNILIFSPGWDNGTAADAGAVTWMNGITGVTGPVSASNSLVGDSSFDQIGYFGVTILSNGNYVLNNQAWRSVGAATWGNGATGITGTVSAANSLVGGHDGDIIGSGGVIEVGDGNYVVLSPEWDNGTATNAGAATWGDGKTGISGSVSSTNSLVGSTAYDKVGFSVVPLTNGNYVVVSSIWDLGAIVDAGAVTWADGTIGISGPISVANSLVGSTNFDYVGVLGVRALANGNYVVGSLGWDSASAADVGAVTWANGTTGITGTISAANSLVGSSPGDNIGSVGLNQLPGGDYVVVSPNWDNGAAVDAGAVTWGNGTTGITGTISAANSLVGSSTNDQVGGQLGIMELANGNYVVISPDWDNGALVDAGAITWGDGRTGIRGPISAGNSLVGSKIDDKIGSFFIDPLDNGDYVVYTPTWDNGPLVEAGAVTFGSGTAGVQGEINAENSVLGVKAQEAGSFYYVYDSVNQQLVIGYLADQNVTLFRPNRTPIANAGLPQNVERGALVRLDGSASYDPDGNLPLVFTWTQTGGPPVVLSDPQAILPTFTAPDERTALTFNLVVTDALGSSSKPARAIVFVDPYQYFWPLMPEQ